MNSTIQNHVIKTYEWSWQGQTVNATYEIAGNGPPLLLLPAFSTVSSRTEVADIADLLGHKYQTIALDWPGFGDSDRPKLDYAPDLYQRFLQDFIRDCIPQPATLLATGHSAGYALQSLQDQPTAWERLILVAPTWRGPLPTMMKGQRPWFKILRNVVRTPILGQFLYQLNTTKSFLRMMYSRHVYANPQNITAELIDRKQIITQQPGARFAPVASDDRSIQFPTAIPRADYADFGANWGR
jgi:pimeloyl-ACP methyl ester carboxylesterase